MNCKGDGVVFGLLAVALAFTGKFPKVDGDIQTGIAAAGLLNFARYARHFMNNVG